MTWKLAQNTANSLQIKTLNETYKKIAEKYAIHYQAFTENELQGISEYPQPLFLNPPNHIETIVIKNFRRFENLALHQLGQFNLILGDNNVGKTSLLEALLFTPNFDEYLSLLAFTHCQKSGISKKEVLKDFISSFSNRDKAIKGLFSFEIRQKRSQWHYDFRKVTATEIREKLLLQNNSIDSKDYVGLENEGDILVTDLTILLKRFEENHQAHPFIPFGKGFGRDLAQIYYDEVSQSRKVRNEFVENMKIFIPNIIGITPSTSDGEISIEESSSEISFPLHDYGEGANKLFRILLQLTLCKGKRLMIDEIDAGIHYSRFASFWEIILKVAKDNEIQIFATTHNQECMKFFTEILQKDDFEEYRAKSSMITLEELPNRTIKAYIRKYEEFEFNVENNYEIRGGA